MDKKKVVLYLGMGVAVTGLAFGAGFLGSMVGRDMPAPVTEDVAGTVKDGSDETLDETKEDTAAAEEATKPTVDEAKAEPAAESVAEKETEPAKDTAPKKATASTTPSAQKEVSVKGDTTTTVQTSTAQTSTAQADAKQPYDSSKTAEELPKNSTGQTVYYDNGNGTQVVSTPDGKIGFNTTTGQISDADYTALDQAIADNRSAEQKAADDAYAAQQAANAAAREETKRQQEADVPVVVE